MRLFAFALILPLAMALAQHGLKTRRRMRNGRKYSSPNWPMKPLPFSKRKPPRRSRNGFSQNSGRARNMRRIARFTLGPFARKISDEDFATYQQLLNELIIKVYANSPRRIWQ